MKRTAVCLLSAFFMFFSTASAEQKTADLMLLKQGEDRHFIWSLYQYTSSTDEIDLVLTIKNTGAKHLDLSGIDAAYFSFKDSKGKSVKIWSATGFNGVAYGRVTVGHLYIEGPASPKETYSLFMKKKKDAFVPVSFRARGLKLSVSGNK